MNKKDKTILNIIDNLNIILITLALDRYIPRGLIKDISLALGKLNNFTLSEISFGIKLISEKLNNNI